MQRWLAESVKAIERMKIMWAEGAFDYNLDEECNAYGGCLFRRVCMSEDPTPWLEGYYSQRVWDPLVHQEREFTDEDRAKWTLVERKE
jgi:hypothetical protein